MASDAAIVYKPSNLTGMGHDGFNGDSSTPQATAGSLIFTVDRYGPKILKYVRNRNGSAVTMGELMALIGAANESQTAVTDITSGSTTTAVTTGLTANDHDGMLCYVFDNADSAGAAPEGEVGIVASNTTTTINLEDDYPLSTALAANDDLELIANWQVHDSADGDPAAIVAGVVVGVDGISNGNYGWVQNYGYCVADITTAATTLYDCLVADANVLGDGGSDGVELWCATALAVATADQVAQTCPVNLTIFQAFGLGTP